MNIIKILVFCNFCHIVFLKTGNCQTGQINIPRVELMPNQPSPFNLRDWKSVATKYDTSIFDIANTGQYLPAVSIQSEGVNYPGYPSFGLHTYIGTNSPNGNEAINVLPSLVGASLCGINKMSQFNQNWVKMSFDFFSKNDNQGIYLNNKLGGSGADWWYDMMPNIYFYQLYNLYNPGSESAQQFKSIADKMLASVKVLGGNDTPWSNAGFDYRGFNFKTMLPNPNGVKEPEAAGAYAWLLYMAYLETGNENYRKGAEWSLEFLNQRTSNPSYELMLPYGTCVAARMNAELGTQYNIEKMINWSFEKGPLRNWGTIVGKWGGFDVSGLVGEANDQGNDYAFQLNGVQQLAALAPMVRYDKRFARAIAKWALNLANATRLFYPGFLPANYQDNASWSNAEDPDRVIGYEALREKWQGFSPYSTGDALAGGWAKTNLSLYSTGSIGYMGSILESTDVEKILKIDVLKTDFFSANSYPTHLIYNPYYEAKKVKFNIGSESKDVYDALSEKFVLTGVSGNIELMIPGNQAVLVTACPAGGNITFDKNKMLVNGVVVDYSQNQNAWIKPPRIQSLASKSYIVEKGLKTNLYATVQPGQSSTLKYTWKSTQGIIIGNDSVVEWQAGSKTGKDTIVLIATDLNNLYDTDTIEILVVEKINKAPVIFEIKMSNTFTSPGGTIDVACIAEDPDGDDLRYEWSFSDGNYAQVDYEATWTAPASEGIIDVSCKVTDDKGLVSSISRKILVKIFTDNIEPKLIAYYNLNGNVNDQTQNQLHGIPFNTVYVPDAKAQNQKAMYFNGVNGRVSINNAPVLNFKDGISVSFWLKANDLPAKETFIVSHGSWQSRWKVSCTPDQYLRWTVNTENGIFDLDTPNPLQRDSFYHVVCTYNNKLAAIYINGQLVSFKFHSGKINTTTHALLLGQMLPGNVEYNFKGVIDEVRIYDQALIPQSANQVYNLLTKTKEINKETLQFEITPNPTSEKLKISLNQNLSFPIVYSIYDQMGNKIINSHVTQDNNFINVESLQSGVYLLIIHTNNKYIAQRFIKL